MIFATFCHVKSTFIAYNTRHRERFLAIFQVSIENIKHFLRVEWRVNFSAGSKSYCYHQEDFRQKANFSCNKNEDTEWTFIHSFSCTKIYRRYKRRHFMKKYALTLGLSIMALAACGKQAEQADSKPDSQPAEETTMACLLYTSPSPRD